MSILGWSVALSTKGYTRAESRLVNPHAVDSEQALKEEKIREIMKQTGQENIQLFDRVGGPQKNNLIYLNNQRIELTEKLIDLRRENVRLGLFKLDKQMTLWEVLLGVAVVTLIIVGIIFVSRRVQQFRRYIDPLIFDTLLELTPSYLILCIILAAFNIISSVIRTPVMTTSFCIS